MCKIHSKTHTLSSLRGRGKGYLYFKQMREGNFKKIIEALVSLPQRMLGNRVHSSLLRRRLMSTQEFPRDGVARVAEGPPWRCGGTLQGGRRLRGQGRPEREGGRSERSRGKRGSRQRGGTWGDARFGEVSPGRYLPLRSQKPERIRCPGEKAAPATAEPCPGDARAGATHSACAVPLSGRTS